MPTAVRATISVLSLMATCAVAGCTNASGPELLPKIGPKSPDAHIPGQPYKLTAEERSLDCKRLTGRMQVRILQIRDASERSSGTALAGGLQSAITPVLGGTTYGSDRQVDVARDKAVLEAMNGLLADKKCATYDLDAELRPRSVRDTPTPVPKGAAVKAP